MDVIVGTAGHIDHGKTALVKALTGTDADRLPEEKRRGITVDLGFAELSAGDIHLGFVDVPGHERFVKNMLAGASGIDVVILVIAADDGVMPQTREHFEICRLLGVRSGIIAVTKCDLVDAETLELAKMEAAELVAGSFLEDAPIVAISSRTGEGVDEVKASLLRSASSLDKANDQLVARLPVDRSFSMKGFGTVVTGTLASGEIKDGDELELLPVGRQVRVRGLQSHGNSVSHVHRGQRVALNLAGIGHDEIERGMLLSVPGILKPSQIMDVDLEVLKEASRPLRSRQRVRLHIGTAEVLARVQVINSVGEVPPGGRSLAQLTLEGPVAAVPGERFIIRSYSPQITIAGGEVVDNLAAKHRRRDFAGVTEHLDQLRTAQSTAEMITEIVRHSSRRGVEFSRLLARTGIAAGDIRSAIETLVNSGMVIDAGGHLIAAKPFDELQAETIDAIGAFHKKQPLAKGISREGLRDPVLSNVPAVIVDAIIDALVRSGRIVNEGDTIRLNEFSNVLSPAEALVRDRIRETIGAAKLNVEKIDEIIARSIAGATVSTQQAAKLLRLFLDSGEIVKVSEDFYFDKLVIDGLRVKLCEFADASADRLIDVGAFKDLAGVSRKYAIPLLEYFDREKITVRAGEKRLIR